MTEVPGFQAPPPPGGGDPAAMVKMPAILLIASTIFGVLVRGYLLLNALGVAVAGAQGGQGGTMNMLSGGFAIVFGILSILIAFVVCFGAFKMMKLQSYGLAMTAAVISMIPCISACCVVTLPFGIWALVVLMKPEVKSAFH